MKALILIVGSIIALTGVGITAKPYLARPAEQPDASRVKAGSHAEDSPVDSVAPPVLSGLAVADASTLLVIEHSSNTILAVDRSGKARPGLGCYPVVLRSDQGLGPIHSVRGSSPSLTYSLAPKMSASMS